jgi:hypothetical protein
MSDGSQAAASAGRSRSIAAGTANLRPWQAGQSGNPAGRPPALVDIAALAREHGPKCIEVAAALLNSDDERIRLAAVIALLDRGFGRPPQAIVTPDNTQSITFMHLVAARAFSDELAAERAAAENSGAPTISGKAAPAPRNLFEPALE